MQESPSALEPGFMQGSFKMYSSKKLHVHQPVHQPTKVHQKHISLWNPSYSCIGEILLFRHQQREGIYPTCTA